MPRLTYQTSLLLAPLAYAIHHAEEHLIFSFREWRLSYFPDNNALTTEAVLTVLMGVTFIYLLFNAVLKNRLCAVLTIAFFMSSQVSNAIFHAVGTVVFQDFSPGLITGVLLYLPVNFLICRAAISEGLISTRMVFAMFVLGGAIFLLFEAFGPIVLFASTFTTWLLMAFSGFHQRNSSTTKPGIATQTG